VAFGVANASLAVIRYAVIDLLARAVLMCVSIPKEILLNSPFRFRRHGRGTGLFLYIRIKVNNGKV